MIKDDRALLIDALDRGGELPASEVRNDSRLSDSMNHLRDLGLFVYVAENGTPAVFRLTDAGRKRAAEFA